MKSYREFHADIFPETSGFEAPIYASQWVKGTDATVDKVSLDPNQSQGKSLHVMKFLILLRNCYLKRSRFQMIRGPLSRRKEEIKVPVKPTPVPKPRKSVTEEVPSKVGIKSLKKLFHFIILIVFFSLLSHRSPSLE